jgi:hypothetical protein
MTGDRCGTGNDFECSQADMPIEAAFGAERKMCSSPAGTSGSSTFATRQVVCILCSVHRAERMWTIANTNVRDCSAGVRGTKDVHTDMMILAFAMN